MRTFIEVARQGSFAAAARAIDADASIISRTIAGLERELGVRLFQRSTRRLNLTEAGALYLSRVEPVLEELDRAGQDVMALGREPAGCLRLTSSVAFGQICLTPLLPAFRTTFPNLELELVLTDRPLDLVAERIDMAIRLGPSVDGDLICSKLLDTRYRVVASPAYLAKAPTIDAPGDLCQHDALLFALKAFRTRWLFRGRDGRIIEVPIKGKLSTSNAVMLRDGMLQGLGPALLANWLIDRDLDEGHCIDLFPGQEVAVTS